MSLEKPYTFRQSLTQIILFFLFSRQKKASFPMLLGIGWKIQLFFFCKNIKEKLNNTNIFSYNSAEKK
jgi:hypothetical protein